LPAQSTKSCPTDLDPAIAHAMRLFLTLKQITQPQGRVWKALHEIDEETRREYLLLLHEAEHALTQQIQVLEMTLHG
jgi:hypothetical protein